MSNKPVTDALKKALADTYTLMIKTHNYHWNVEGPDFRGLHMMFEEQYTELFAAVDVIAERIRALGEKAPASMSEFSKLTKIKDGNNANDAAAMLADLHASNLQAAETMKKLFEVTEKAEDGASNDLSNQRRAAHEKAAWMLRASLPKGAKLKLAV
ncbi:MAG: Dps family protein [Rickettsiales bacterium]